MLSVTLTGRRVADRGTLVFLCVCRCTGLALTYISRNYLGNLPHLKFSDSRNFPGNMSPLRLSSVEFPTAVPGIPYRPPT